MSAGLESFLTEQTTDLGDWREEVRSFVRDELPAALARKVALGLKLHKEDYVQWQKILYAKGWFAGAWPKRFGGQDWDLEKQLIFTQQSAIDHAPMVIPYGVSMVGPVLYTYGSEEQQREHLPDILSSDVWWCQGYSEPGSGSDLASLVTAAVRDGDHYRVNGTKMWTTEAHWADKMHCLVRTSRDAKPQQGISFLLIDMKSPGIAVTPIVTLDGIHHTNQVFFDNVMVPCQNRIGEEGQGWEIAKFLLGNERTSIADTGPKLRLLGHVQAQFARWAASGEKSAEQKILARSRLTDAELQLLTLCALERRYVKEWVGGKRPGADASLLKIRGTEVLQILTELALEFEEPLAGAHDPADLFRDPLLPSSAAQCASAVAHEYLYSRCWSIFGGTNEIQRNIIARQLLT